MWYTKAVNWSDDKMLKLADVAKLAHVSKATASLALNNKPGVSDATRQKIKEIVKQAGYTPLRARNKTRSFDLVAIKSENILKEDFSRQPFFQNMLAIFSSEVSQFSARLNVVILDMQELKRGDYSLTGDGILLLGTDLSPEAVTLVQQFQPNLVVVDTNFPIIDANFITMDSYRGSYQAATFLANKGFSKIGYLASKFRMYNYDERRRGFEDGLAAANLSLDPTNIYHFSPIVPNPSQTEINRITKRTSLPDVFFCEDDYLAIALLKIYQQYHISVPADVALMGFNDISEDKLVFPEISTVHVPMQEMVHQSLLTLTKLLDAELTANVRILVGTHIVERGSTDTEKNY